VKVPRHIVTPYITNPVGRELEPLITPQRKYYSLSRLCGRSWGEKSLACTNEKVFIAKGETDPCGCSTTFMIIWLPWIFDFTWLFIQQVGLLDFHVTLHWLIVWPTVEMWKTWLMIGLDMTVLVYSYYCWCACQDAVLVVMDVLMVCHSFTSTCQHALCLR